MDPAVKHATAEAQAEYLAVLSAEWVQQVKRDPEIGGKNLRRIQECATFALDRYATPKLRRLLQETGFGNHPEVVRFIARLGAALKSHPDSITELLYPKSLMRKRGKTKKK